MSTRWRNRWRWALTASTLVCVVAWVGSVWVEVEVYVASCGVALMPSVVGCEIESGEPWPSAIIVSRAGQHHMWWWWFFFRNDSRGCYIRAPLWFPTIVAGIPSVLLWRAHFRRRRLAGDCRVCGYSLAGLAPGTVCPECGASPKG